MLDTINSNDLTEIMAYDSINPPAERKICTYLAHILWVLVNKDRPKDADMIPYETCCFGEPEQKKRRKKADMTDDEMLSTLRGLYKDIDNGNHSNASDNLHG